MNTECLESDTYDIIQSIVKAVLDQKLPKDQIEELGKTLTLIVEEYQNMLLDYFDETDQSLLFYNQQNINYPNFGYNYDLLYNYNRSLPPYLTAMQGNGFIQSPSSMNIPIPPILPPISSLSNLLKTKPKSDKKEEKKKKKEKEREKKKEKTKKKKKKVRKIKTTTTGKLLDITDSIFDQYFNKILFMVKPPLELGSDGLRAVGSFIIKILNKLATQIRRKAKSDGKKEINQQDVEDGIRAIIPGDLMGLCLSEAGKYVAEYNCGDKHSYLSIDLFLSFNIDLVIRFLNEAKCADSVNINAAIAMAAVMDFLTIEVLVTAGDVCMENEREVISAHDINTAISNNEKLNLLQNRINK